MKLLGSVLERTEVVDEGRIALLMVTRAMLADVGADDEMVEGMVNYGRMLKSVEISALVWELPSENGPMTKVSLRSSGRADVATIAKAMDGGGHRAAAGANVAVPIEVARERVLELARAELAALEPWR